MTFQLIAMIFAGQETHESFSEVRKYTYNQIK